ncbi:uncharacterized protein LOC131255878 isoform X1 [Magnolia sinica]|uniref:uncharacterized protein LOC131255878 isoform X1 n=1 Tax=Magnolia sinica TaxID=86752 RepID=UPI00265A47A6|nr:uncharacterized protein LOC131255878 isoform X1 [Magnolia sinica]
MDSKEGSGGIRRSSSLSSNQESSIFNDISNMSPVKPCKPQDVGQPIFELSSPSLQRVFGSPQKSQRETSFAQRPRHPSSSDAEPCLKENTRHKILSGQGVSRPHVMQSRVQSIPPCTKVCDTRGSVQVQPSRPLGCVDEFMADPLKVGVNSSGSSNLHSNQAIDLKEATVKVLVDDNVQKDMETQARDDPESKKSFPLVKPIRKVDGKWASGLAEKSDEKPHIMFPELVSENASGLTESNLSMESAFGKRHDQHLVSQAAANISPSMPKSKECGILKFEKEMLVSSPGFHHHGMQDKLQAEESMQQGICDHTPRSLPESFDSAQLTDIHIENDRIIYNRSIENHMRYDGKEANQHQRDMHRRRLQFEGAEARTKITGTVSSSWNRANAGLSARPLASPVGLNTSNACTAEPNMASRNKQVINSPQHTSPRLPIGSFKIQESHIDKADRSAPKTAPMPSSIGLHLNDIGNAVTVNRGLHTQLAGKDHLSVQREKSLTGSDRHLPEDSRCQLVPLVAFGNSLAKLTSKSDSPSPYSVRTHTELDQQECQASVTANSSGSFQTSQKMKPWDNSLLIDQHVIPCENKRIASQDISSFEKFGQMSPRKKRKEEPYPTENDECKRCSCKKSKCLKLYCDCFAAGVYCAESCSCQECFNKTEYDDTISGTRQQIVSRNPLAFAPKIVRRVESPQNCVEDGNQTTLASARHKRGCNCKKSMCLKKYCECYQAGVGCSDGCRCEGCKNVFGKKEVCFSVGHGEILEVEHRKVADERWGDPHRLFDGKMGMHENQGYISHPVQCHSDAVPPTLLFQYPNQRRDTPQSWNLPRRHPASSPKSEISVLSPGNFSSNDKFLKTIEGNVITYDTRPDYLESEMVDSFSPRWDALTDISNVMPLAQDPQSMSSSDSICLLKASQTQLCHGNVHFSAGKPSSHIRHGSHMSPNPRFGGNKFGSDPSSDTRLYNIQEEETHSPPKGSEGKFSKSRAGASSRK